MSLVEKVLRILIVFSAEDADWAAQFTDALDAALAQLGAPNWRIVLGKEAQLDAADWSEADCLVAVVSAQLAASQPCLDAVDRWRAVATARPLLSAIRSPLEAGLLPTQLQATPVYAFHSSDAERDYWMSLLDLASDIREAAAHGATEPMPKRTVFLAESTSDMAIQRHILRQELQRVGYRVLPREPQLQQEGLAWEDSMSQDLEKSDLAIHLIGQFSSEQLKDIESSAVAVQGRLAKEQNLMRPPGQKLARLAWVSPAAAKVGNGWQGSLATLLKRSIDPGDWTEISEEPFEIFKRMARNKLREMDAPQTPHRPKSGLTAYVACDFADNQLVQHCLETIKKSKFETIQPPRADKLADARRQYIEALCAADVMVIFKGRASKSWLEMKILDVLKAPGLGRQKPFLEKIVVAPHGNEAELEYVVRHGMKLICGLEDEALLRLEQLLRAIGPIDQNHG